MNVLEKAEQLLTEVRNVTTGGIPAMQKAEKASSVVKDIAARDFREWNHVIFEDMHYLGVSGDLKKAIADIYREEISSLLYYERICPCCGQPTRGDIDY